VTPPAAVAAAFAEDVISAGAVVRLPAALSSPPADALHRVADRHGVALTALRTTSLTHAEVADLLRFRFAQYLDCGFVDRQAAWAWQMRAEPESVVAPSDVHIIAGVPDTGEILAYMVIEAPPPTPPGCRMRSQDRALFPVEQVHGAGIYHRLPILPDLPVAKVREMGRLIRNGRPASGWDLVGRAVVEVCVAAYRMAMGPMRMEMDAVIGDLELGVVKRNLDLLHVPSVLIYGTVPYLPGTSHLSPRYQLHTVYPYACLVSDVDTALPQLDAIEEALGIPGDGYLRSLRRLRSQGAISPSTLCPVQGAQAVDASLPQQQTDMRARSRLLEQGAWLRHVRAFASLSVAEAALLCTGLRRVSIQAGQVIIRQGEQADALYIVEAGEASVDLADDAGTGHRIGSLRPYQCCGHAAVIDGAEHPVTVTAITDMTILRLDNTARSSCLASYPEVNEQLAHDALRLLVQVDRHRRQAQAAAPHRQCGCGDDCACTGRVNPASSGTPAAA
jgi:hypothetical protein